VYQSISLLKRDNESVSKVIERLIGKKKNILEIAGVWKDMSDEEYSTIMKGLESERHGR